MIKMLDTEIVDLKVPMFGLNGEVYYYALFGIPSLEPKAEIVLLWVRMSFTCCVVVLRFTRVGMSASSFLLNATMLKVLQHFNLRRLIARSIYGTRSRHIAGSLHDLY